MSEPGLALDPDGRVVAYRSHGGEAWWTFTVPSKGIGYVSDLPDGWVRYVPATGRDLVAEELERIGEQLEAAAESLDWLRRQRSRTAGQPDVVCICNPTHRPDDPICQWRETT